MFQILALTIKSAITYDDVLRNPIDNQVAPKPPPHPNFIYLKQSGELVGFIDAYGEAEWSTKSPFDLINNNDPDLLSDIDKIDIDPGFLMMAGALCKLTIQEKAILVEFTKITLELETNRQECKPGYCYQTIVHPIHCKYDIRSGNPLICRGTTDAIFYAEHRHIDNRYIMDVHQSVIHVDIYYKDDIAAVFCRMKLTNLFQVGLATQPRSISKRKKNIAGYPSLRYARYGWEYKQRGSEINGIRTDYPLLSKFFWKTYSADQVIELSGTDAPVKRIGVQVETSGQIESTHVDVIYSQPILSDLPRLEGTGRYFLEDKSNNVSGYNHRLKKQSITQLAGTVFILILILQISFGYNRRKNWRFYLLRPRQFVRDIFEYVNIKVRTRKPIHQSNSSSDIFISGSSVSVPISAGRTPSPNNSQIEDLNYKKYDREYSTDKILGKGGFGLVFQAKRRGDGQLLAVKRIKVGNNDQKERVWREAELHRLLSNHDVEFTNLIQYYDAWEEVIHLEDIKNHDEIFIADFNNKNKDIVTEIISESSHEVPSEEVNPHKNVNLSSKHSALSDFAGSESWQGSDTWSESEDNAHENGNYVMHDSSFDAEESSSSEKVVEPTDGIRYRGTHSPSHTNDFGISNMMPKRYSDSDEDTRTFSIDSFGILSHSPTTDNFKEIKLENSTAGDDRYIFLVSQLCEPETLKYKLARRKKVDKIFSAKIFIQILKGVKVLHNLGFIHRDLKPANVFFSRDKNVIKIGDFGLMTATAHTIGKLSETIPVSQKIALFSTSQNRHTSHIGTQMYMAPEIKDGNYSLPVDIYSLGIILFELFSIFTSRMDRTIQIRSVKMSIFDDELRSYPGVVDLIEEMLQLDPKMRPTIDDVLLDFDNTMFEK